MGALAVDHAAQTTHPHTKHKQETDLVFAGFPCVDISRCGRQAGLEGDRSGLFFVVIKLLEKAIANNRPVPFVLLENVEALLDRVRGGDGGLQEPAIARVVAELTRLNYMVAYQVPPWPGGRGQGGARRAREHAGRAHPLHAHLPRSPHLRRYACTT